MIVKDDRVLICQRRLDQSFPTQWEFPGGKVEPGESLTTALARELSEELGIEARIGRELATVHHTYATGFAVELHFFLVEGYTGAIRNRIFQQLRWEEPAALRAESFLEADRGVVRSLRDGELSLD